MCILILRRIYTDYSLKYYKKLFIILIPSDTEQCCEIISDH